MQKDIASPRLPQEVFLSIRNFCKSRPTKGLKMDALYRSYVNLSEHPKYPIMTRDEFETGLLVMKRTVALDLKKKCIEYAGMHGLNSFEKFIEEEELITREFWSKVIEESLFKNARLLRAERLQCIEQAPQSPVDPPVLMTPKQEPQETKLQDQFKKILPKTWGRMGHPERVEFTKKVQHEGFFKYILSIDPRLQEYFSKEKKPKDPLKIYVTIFSIPAESYSVEAKNLLKCFVNTLNMFGRARLQYIECSDPDVIEIREVR